MTLLLSNGLVKNLELYSLNELDDEFFQGLFSIPTYNGHIHDSIENLSLVKMNSLTSHLILSFFLKNDTKFLKISKEIKQILNVFILGYIFVENTKSFEHAFRHFIVIYIFKIISYSFILNIYYKYF